MIAIHFFFFFVFYTETPGTWATLLLVFQSCFAEYWSDVIPYIHIKSILLFNKCVFSAFLNCLQKSQHAETDGPCSILNTLYNMV